MSGFGFGSFLFSFISTYIVNPNNLAPDKMVVGGLIFTQPEIIERVPFMLHLLCLFWATLSLIAVGLIFKLRGKDEGSESHSEINQYEIQQQYLFSDESDSSSFEIECLPMQKRIEHQEKKNLIRLSVKLNSP